jgi:hypothetical protein
LLPGAAAVGEANEVLPGSGCNLHLIRRRLTAASVDNKLVLNLLAFNETAEARAVKGVDMNEDVLPPGFRLNESEPPLRIEPFYNTGMHDTSFLRTTGWALATGDAGSIDVLERKSFADMPSLA